MLEYEDYHETKLHKFKGGGVNCLQLLPKVIFL